MTPNEIFESAMMFFALPFAMFGMAFWLMRETILKPHMYEEKSPLMEDLLLFFVGGGWIMLLLPAMGTVSLIAMLRNALN